MTPRSDLVADAFERGMAHWSAPLVFLCAYAVGFYLGPDRADGAVGLFTGFVLILLTDRGRRDRKAMQVKLDEIVRKLPQTDSGKAGLEDRQEDEIDARRDC